MKPQDTQPPGEPRQPEPNVSERTLLGELQGLAERALEQATAARVALNGEHMRQIAAETPERLRQAQMRE